LNAKLISFFWHFMRHPWSQNISAANKNEYWFRAHGI
jgi:hypothetical protein